ncbi:MAG TPA: pentapeptide repeat-containing protein [Thermoleophilaceae bacterium]
MLFAAVVIFAVVLALIVVFAVLPNLVVSDSAVKAEVDRVKLENDVRRTGAQILAGLLVLGGLFLTARSIRVTREGQLTERFSRAIDQLGHEELDVRLGGIYSLERIARDSASDRGPVNEVLSAWLRRKSRVRRRGTGRRLPEDVRAVLVVLGRRPKAPSSNADRVDLTSIDLRSADLLVLDLPRAVLSDARLDGADLTRAKLNQAHLTRAHFENADLTGAELKKATLTNARFDAADLSETTLTKATCTSGSFIDATLASSVLSRAEFAHADLSRSDLQGAKARKTNFARARLAGANLTRADVRGASFLGASLRGANLSGTTLKRADLRGADLRNAAGLTAEQVAVARCDMTTRFSAPDPATRQD